jgi:DNA adenine methylase
MLVTETVRPQFPSTRYMGSKAAVLERIRQVVADLPFTSALDAFSGSGCIAHMFKRMGKVVYANDYLRYSYTIAKATVENAAVTLNEAQTKALLRLNPKAGTFVQDTFAGLYFSDEENRLIDNILANVRALECPYVASLARAALARACLKRRPRGVFSYTGRRYDDGRKDLRISLAEHFRKAVAELNRAVFDNGRRNRAFNCDVFDLDISADLVYLDPPYYTPHSDNDYLRRYHFLEGLCCDWRGVEILTETKTKKLKKYPTPFASRTQVYEAFRRLFARFADSIIVLSYSSNGIPRKEELLAMLGEVKPHVELHEMAHRYSFGTHGHKGGNRRNTVTEYLFVAR